jgi:hypothetical protein
MGLPRGLATQWLAFLGVCLDKPSHKTYDCSMTFYRLPTLTLTALLLVGCSDNDSKFTSQEQKVIKAIREEAPTWRNYTDVEVAAYLDAVCITKMPPPEVLGVSETDRGYLTGIGLSAWCER